MIDAHEVLAADLREMGFGGMAADVERRRDREGPLWPVGDARPVAYRAAVTLCVSLAAMIMQGRDGFHPILEQVLPIAAAMRPRGPSA